MPLLHRRHSQPNSVRPYSREPAPIRRSHPRLTLRSGRSSLAAALLARIAAILLVAIVGGTRGAAGTLPREHRDKAVALYNIISFSEWPATSFTFTRPSLVIGILGQDDTTTALNEVMANERWQGRAIEMRRVATVDEIRQCHVLYIARSEHARWRGMNTLFAGLPILTVSDAPDFVRTGGMVQLTVERRKLHLRVNLGAARTAGVTISSKVLRLAEVIDDRRL